MLKCAPSWAEVHNKECGQAAQDGELCSRDRGQHWMQFCCTWNTKLKLDPFVFSWLRKSSQAAVKYLVSNARHKMMKQEHFNRGDVICSSFSNSNYSACVLWISHWNYTSLKLAWNQKHDCLRLHSLHHMEQAACSQPWCIKSVYQRCLDALCCCIQANISTDSNLFGFITPEVSHRWRIWMNSAVISPW